MSKTNKVKSIIVILVLLLMSVYLVNNRTKNVFEEIFYSENPDIIKSGVTKSSLAFVKGFYRADRDMENDLGGIKIYTMKENEFKSKWIDIEKGNRLMIKTWIEDGDYIITLHYKYECKTKKLYVSYYFENLHTNENTQNVEEVLQQFLETQGIEASDLKEVSDIMLEEFLNQWFEGNSMSKFNMDNLGDFEIVYE